MGLTAKSSDQSPAPSGYFLDFEHDLPSTDTLQKIALSVIPFICLYKPFGLAVSLTAGTAQVITHFSKTIESASEKKGLETLDHFKETTLAAISIAATIFNFKTCLFITSFANALKNLSKASELISEKDYPQAFEALMQATASILSITFMLYGTPHVMLYTMLLQASISVYQAALELKERNYPQALVKLGLGAYKFNEAHNHFQTIQKTNELIKKIIEALENENKVIKSQSNGLISNHVNGTSSNGPSHHLINQADRIRKAIKDSDHLKNSPLLKEKQEIISSDADGKKYNLGSYYHGFGKGLVKGMNLQFRATKIDNTNMKEIDFKINHVFRQELEHLLQQMIHFTPNENKTLLNFSESHAKELKFEQVPFKLGIDETFGFAHKISFQGLGNIFIGSSPEMPTMYNLVRVQIQKNKTLLDVHEMLSFLNLHAALKVSSPEDIERLKIGHLFRIFNPKEAYTLERQAKFFTLSIGDLKKEIISKVPQMLNTMNQYLSKMKTTEILPGKLRYIVPGIAKEVHKLGGRFLITTITGDPSPIELSKRVSSILKTGLLSSETRLRNGIPKMGISTHSDFEHGSSDKVFTQLLTKRAFDQNLVLNNLYQGNIRILFSLDNLDSGTYQYTFDNYGDRKGLNYQTRSNILSFTQQEQLEFDYGNEVVLEAISGKTAKKIIVSNKQQLNIVLKWLRQLGNIKKVQGKETVNGIPLNKFLVVSNKLSPALIN